MKKPKPIKSTLGHGPAVTPELQTLDIRLIDEPDLPARETMDVDAMNELRESMSVLGLLSPIVVVKSAKRYQTVAGHRRLLSARALGWSEIRALVYPDGWKHSAAAMLHENIIREQLNPAQEAVFFAQLLETHKLDEESLCAAVKRSPDYVGDRLQLLRGDVRIFQALREGKINVSVARILNRFDTDGMRGYYLEQAVRSGTSARVVDQWYHDWRANQAPGTEQPPQALQENPRPEVVNSPIACFLCGGHLDPYNLISVYIHHWELTQIKKMLDVRTLNEESSIQ